MKNDKINNIKFLFFNNEIDNIEEKKQLRSVIKMPLIAGAIVFFIVITVFVIWGGTAPLDSAAIASGTLVVDSKRKTVQHFEGGVISEIVIKEGDYVKRNQDLIYLNNIAAKSKNDLLQNQLYLYQANETRLVAARDMVDEIIFDDEMTSEDPVKNRILQTQKRLLKTQIDGLKNKAEILRQKILQFEESLTGLAAQKKSIETRIKLNEGELKTAIELLKDGLITKTHLVELQTRQADLEGNLGQIISQIASTKESVAETKLQIINNEHEFQKEVINELKETRKQIADLQEQLFASQDILQRTVIKAPIEGKITGLKYHTIGGVITPGSAITDIVPENDDIIVEAKISPQDIDIVYAGMKAKIMLSSYKSRFVPRVEGEVLQVSADIFTEEQSGQPYYIARIKINKEAIDNLAYKVTLYPGMPAEVFIPTGERTMLQYLASPVIDSFRRAFKEE